MHRRKFLKYVAGSPLLATIPFHELISQDNYIISSPEDALSVLEFEAAAHKILPPAHFGYMATGVDDDNTLRANREGFSRFALRDRRLVDVSKIDMKTELFGQMLDAPILLSPVGRQRAFNPEGEVATARAAKAKNTAQILSGAASLGIDEVTAARGAPLWYQLYNRPDFEATLQLVKRAEAAGSPVLVWTVDILPGRNLETENRFRRIDTRTCSTCHGANYTGRQGFGTGSPITWEWVRRLKDATKMKLVIKGIDTAEDAALCVENGADGVLLSNHGGRSTETGRGTIECLPEVIKAVDGKIPVVIDGGFRRGSDVFKALALGARAVCIGRPYIWGLAAFGQPGVEKVIDIMRAELNLIMRQCGTRNIAEITSRSVIQR
jgi:4-hydroxymandelate oxidase